MARLRRRFTPGAQRNFRHLLARSEREWGQAQAEHYQDRIFAVLELLRDNPLLGVERSDIMPGCRSRVVEHHIVYYQANGDELRVMRILHE